MIYHYITGGEEIFTSLNILIISWFITISQGRRNSYFIKYSDNIMIYHYITEVEEEILTSLNILIISWFIIYITGEEEILASLNILIISWFITISQGKKKFLLH